MTIVKLSGGDLGGETMRVRCDLTRAESPVQVDYDCDGNWTPTQWQCADARHSVAGLTAIAERLAAEAVQVPEDDFSCESESFGLAHEADTTHEDAREWYDSYGWHLTTEKAGDVLLQACEYDWLDEENDDEVADKMREWDSDLTRDEALSIAHKARSVRDDAEVVCGLLDEAVEAYNRADYDAVVAALDKAKSVESAHGDSPASNSLRAELVISDYPALQHPPSM